jgi:NAD+ kinase
MKSIGINVNTTKDHERQMLDFVIKAIHDQSEHINLKVYEDAKGLDENESSKLDVIIVLGGDGTILNTSRHIYKNSTPILGINMGHLGFLAQVDSSSVKFAIKSLFSGDYIVEERSMIECSFEKNGKVKVYNGLNDVVLYKGMWSRIQKYEIFINKKFYNTFNADGMIICTSTGSTAYNLSAGGPIIHPELDILALTPMYSQSLAARTIVISGNSEIVVKGVKDNENIFLAIDGQDWIELDNTKPINICKSQYKCKLVQLHNNDYFSTLRKKITFKAKECEGEGYESYETL